MTDILGAPDKLNILALVEEPETTRQCLTAAAGAAAIRPGSVVTALHVEVDPAKIRAAPEEISIQQMRATHEGSPHDRAIQIQRIFEFWLATNHTVTARWQKVIGTVDATVVQQTIETDLIAICQPHNLDATDGLHASIFHSGKPVLFVPGRSLRSLKLDHLAIAWKDTPQAYKAIEYALPWLAAAQRVSILTVDQTGSARDTGRAEQWLRRHDIPFELHHLKNGSDGHVAWSLIDAAIRIEADALVMGAFRFGQVLEWVFGGVTSEILQRSPLPVFLAH